MAEEVISEYQKMKENALAYMDTASMRIPAKSIVYAILALAEAVRESGMSIPHHHPPENPLYKLRILTKRTPDVTSGVRFFFL